MHIMRITRSLMETKVAVTCCLQMWNNVTFPRSVKMYVYNLKITTRYV